MIKSLKDIFKVTPQILHTFYCAILLGFVYGWNFSEFSKYVGFKKPHFRCICMSLASASILVCCIIAHEVACEQQGYYATQQGS